MTLLQFQIQDLDRFDKLQALPLKTDLHYILARSHHMSPKYIVFYPLTKLQFPAVHHYRYLQLLEKTKYHHLPQMESPQYYYHLYLQHEVTHYSHQI